jgi:flagellar hook assembly protein FlgD
LNVNREYRTDVLVSVYDVNGRKVVTLVQDALPQGTYYVRWNATDSDGKPVAPGIYICRAAAGGAYVTRQIVVTQ